MHVSYNNRPLFLTFTLLTLIWSCKTSVGIAPVMLFPYVAMLFPKRLTKNNKFQCLVMSHMFNNKKKIDGQSDSGLAHFVGARKFHLPDILYIYPTNASSFSLLNPPRKRSSLRSPHPSAQKIVLRKTTPLK